jgi:hypothetical protein
LNVLSCFIFVTAEDVSEFVGQEETIEHGIAPSRRLTLYSATRFGACALKKVKTMLPI